MKTKEIIVRKKIEELLKLIEDEDQFEVLKKRISSTLIGSLSFHGNKRITYYRSIFTLLFILRDNKSISECARIFNLTYSSAGTLNRSLKRYVYDFLRSLDLPAPWGTQEMILILKSAAYSHHKIKLIKNLEEILIKDGVSEKDFLEFGKIKRFDTRSKK